nr:hypothetical protein [Micromonospora sp. DSM 115978]
IDILSQVPHYRTLTTHDISIESVSCASLYSCCHTIKVPRLAKVSPLVDAYSNFTLDPFEPCVKDQPGRRSLILPPIVEKSHDGKHVIVDGMHRLFRVTTHSDVQQVVCLVLRTNEPLPSTPIPFSDVKLSLTKVPRRENFTEYKHEHFREIKIIDRYLADNGV